MHELTDTLVPVLGRALLHFLWQGTLVALLAAIALQLLRDARPQLRYAVACLALLACVLAPLGYIAWAWPRTYVDAGSMLPAAAALAPMQGDPIAAIAAPLRHAGEAVRGVEAFLPAVVLLWAAGACTLSLRLAAGVWWLGRLPVLASPQLQRSWQQRLDALGERSGLRRVVALRLVAALDSPVVVGWWRPVVLLPASLLTRLPADYLEALLAHELAHVRRHDYLVNLLQGMAEALLFYHPATWWLSRRIRVEREHVADRLAAEATGDPRRLALALAALADHQASLHAAPEPALAALSPTGGPLMKRIEQLVRPGHATGGGRIVFPLLGLAAAGLAFYAHAHRDPSASPAGMNVFNSTPSVAIGTAAPAAATVPRGGVVAAVAQASPTPAAHATTAVRATPAAVPTASASVATAPAAPPAPPSPANVPAPPAPPAPATPTAVPAPPAPPAPARPANVPAPPAPPAPPAVQVRMHGNGGESYALVGNGSDGYLMSGSSDDMPQIEALRRSMKGDFLWFRRDGKAYVVTDPATLAQVRKSWAGADALGERMRVLGDQMDGHGRKMEAIGREMENLSDVAEPAAIEAASRQMEVLGRQQGELAERQARLSIAMIDADERKRAALEGQMRSLAEQQEAVSRRMQEQSLRIEAEAERHQRQLQPMEGLSRRMEEASRPMEALGKQMDGLGKQMEVVSQRAERETRQQIDHALETGLARPLSPTQRQ